MTAWSGLRPSSAALVDVDDAGEIGAAGADDLGGDGVGDVVLLEGEEGLEAMALEGVLGDGGLLEAHVGELLAEVGVLLADVAEVDVVGPAVTRVVADAVEEALEGSDDGDDPVAHERDAARVRGGGIDDGAATWTARPMVCASRITMRISGFL